MTEKEFTFLIGMIALAVSLVVLALVVLQEMGRIKEGSSVEHCYDCGKVATVLDCASRLRTNLKDGRRRCRECDK